jgi:Ca-activated chloride channel homolog
MNLLRRLAWPLALTALTLALAWLLRRYVAGAEGPTLAFKRGDATFELLSPRMLALVLLAPWFLWVLGKSLADLPWPQRLISIGLRLAFVALLGLALARLSRTATTAKVCTVFAVDVSDSVPDEGLADARAEVEHALAAKRPDDVVKLITFARRPRVVDLPEPPGKAPEVVRHDAPGSPSKLGSGSNAQAALQLAYGLFPPGYLKRVVLLSDGLQTDGDLLAEAERAKQFGVRVHTLASKRPVPAEVALRELKLPPKVRVGEAFEIHADVYASRATRARARLYQGEALNGLEGVKQLDLKAGPNDLVFKSVVRVPGEVTYALELDQLGEDKFPENNRYAATVDVPGRPAVLYVEGAPQSASYLSSALTAQQYDVDVRPPGGFPASLKELERYDFVILSDTPAEHFGPDAQNLVEAYVRDLGGGFLFAGGESGYSLGGWQHSTVERILPVRMDGEKRKDQPSVALSLVIDRSGSMAGLPIEMAKAAAKAAVEVLQPDDLVEVIAFDSQPTRYVKMSQARRKGRISGDIARIQPGGGTEIFSALDAAYQDMSVTQARKKHVILLTDGKAPTGGIRDVTQAMAAEGITVTTVGLGPDVDDGLLTMIKDVGGGRFHKVPDPTSLPKIFTTETEVVSRQAAQEDWFQVVQSGPAGFLAGVDLASAPFLHGYVSTQMKPPPAQEVLQSDRHEPVLARWRVGLGWSLAWTSDVKNRWAVEWLRWPGFGQFFGQLVREHLRTKHRREFDLKTEIAGGTVRVYVDAFGPDERFENGLDSTLTVVGPVPGNEKRDLPLVQTAPGRYEASFVLDKYGSFLLRAEHRRVLEDGKKTAVAVSYGHVSNPYPQEYARFEPDRETLARVASLTGGKIDPGAPALFDPEGESIAYHEDLWPKAIFAALVVFLLDLFVRRVRLFDRKVLPKGPLPKGA